nr:MAG TPA: hypothetical protein [Caudoviricetes sp.]
MKRHYRHLLILLIGRHCLIILWTWILSKIICHD